MTASAAQLAQEIPRPTIREARAVAYAEWAAMRTLLTNLTKDDWSRPTPCTGWTVHMLISHVVASYAEQARPWLTMQRVRRARRNHPHLNPLEGRNACQVEELAGLSSEELTAEHARLGPRGIRALTRIPAPLRRLKLSTGFGGEDGGMPPQPEDSLDFLIKVLATRDAWMHRIDLADAIGQLPVPAEHDSTVVTQLVRDLATHWHGPGLVITLTGPAGGSWTIGNSSPVGTLTSEAIDFMRHISGRHPNQPPSRHGDPIATRHLAALRIPF